MDRKQFIRIAAAGTFLGMTGLPAFASTEKRKGRLRNFGYISGIIGKELRGDWKSVLKETADFGYTEIETGNYLGESAASFLSYLKSIGITPVIGGIKFTKDKEELNNGIDKLLELKLRYAVTYWPWLVSAPFSHDDCKRSVEILQVMGEVCKERGIGFCWHNHDNEFFDMGAGTPFDFIMENTDPALVKCELDLYWVKKGGADPLEVLKKYSGRFPVLHVKDMAPGSNMDFECPGSGIIDFPSIFAEAERQGIRHYFVERDNVPDGMACLRSAGEYLSKLRW